jgi:hypothetical protein
MELETATSPTLSYASPPDFGAEPVRGGRWLWKLPVVLLILALSAWLVYEGLELRSYAWHHTNGVHFIGDVSNGFDWGRTAYQVGLFNVFDRVQRGELRSNLDYTPLRLTVVYLWARWADTHYPGVNTWSDDYDFTSPMLWFNTISELASAVLIFLLIRLWVIRGDESTRPLDEPARPFRGVAAGMLGALLLWFNPAVIWDGHSWPQWDVWLVPFFLAAVLLASVNWWFAAGVLITIGGYLKGQMWLGAPILLIWPVCQFRFGAALRAIAGLIFSAAFIALPWVHPQLKGMVWYLCALLAMGLLVPFVFRWRLPAVVMVIFAAASALLAWPWTADVSLGWKMAAIAVLPMIAFTRFVNPMLRPSVFALGVGVVLILLMPVYGGSTSWFDVGFQGGAAKYETMLTGNGTYNIPALFSRTFRWPQSVEDVTTLPVIGMVNYRQFASIVYGACLLLCGIGAAVNARRGDRRFLVAMAAPWVLFYILLPQMHGRYLIWGAAMSALLAAESVGLGLLGMIISIIAALGMITNQYNFETGWDPANYQRLMSIRPHLGWMLLLAGAILLYLAIVPRTFRRRRRPITIETHEHALSP